MKISKQLIGLLLSLLFIYLTLAYSFDQSKVFWYLYTFTLLVGMSIAIISSKFKDELPTWKYFIYGIGYGTILYGIIRLGYIILTNINHSTAKTISKFLATYGPSNIWHYLLLIFIVAVGEELFWRGYIQQQLKKWMSPTVAVILTSILFALSIAISGFVPGVIAALFAGVILGFLYEWKQSMPLIILTHEVFVLLLFMILPLS